MADCDLLDLVDGGNKPLLGVRFEPGVDDAVARAHLCVAQVDCDRMMFFTTLLLDGLTRDPPLEDSARHQDLAVPDDLCFSIAPKQLLDAMVAFAGGPFLAIAMDSHTDITLKRMRLRTLTLAEAVSALGRSDRKRFARWERLQGTMPIPTQRTYHWIAGRLGISGATGLRVNHVNFMSAAARLAHHGCISAPTPSSLQARSVCPQPSP